MTRFFVDPNRICSSVVEFDSRDSHHLAVVLKKRALDQVLVCDGKGTEYLVSLIEVSKSGSKGKVVDMYRLATEPHTRVTVAQSLPKTLDKLEWVLQHGTELGADSFIPFYSARSREDWQRLQTKTGRWQEIIRSAAEQSRRAQCPQIDSIRSFDDVLSKMAAFDLSLFAYESEVTTSLKSVLERSTAKNVLIIIGPEGGFTDLEAEKAKATGAVSVSLGPRILRTETAALCLLSQIFYAREQL